MGRCTLRCTTIPYGELNTKRLEQLFQPPGVKKFTDAKMNEIEDHDHQKDGFITDPKVDGHFGTVIFARMVRTFKMEQFRRPFRVNFTNPTLDVPAATTLHQGTW